MDKTRELVIDTFAKSGENVKDGMDISLCRIDHKNRTLTFAGANNPLWILRNGAEEMEEIKADKQPVGLYDGMKPFSEHQRSMSKGDRIYLFTDGYADQFGGEKGKKMKYKPFKNFIISISSQEMSRQQAELQTNFSNWKSGYDQIDDVCIIGIRF